MTRQGQQPREWGWFRGLGGVVRKMDLPLPEPMEAKLRKGHLRRVNADGSPYRGPEEPPAGNDGPPPEDPPAASAQKADWVGWAVRSRGMSVDDAEAMTKADLVALAGQN